MCSGESAPPRGSGRRPALRLAPGTAALRSDFSPARARDAPARGSVSGCAPRHAFDLQMRCVYNYQMYE
ncbi:hypothetical protein B5F39_00505 [Cloacibacillus sp. An23]|nr:hypothetical protein B5F39_00505 [Cloacibacillus sp. An23]